MSKTKFNILANFVGQGWSVLLGLAFIPVYIRLIGVEAFGLIGFYTTLQNALQVLDFGLSPTMHRELARYSAIPQQAGESQDFVRTLEVGYWAIGIAIGVTIMALAPFIASQWIKADVLSTSVVEQSVMLMGLLAMSQWPLSFYQGGLLGLQRQALLNIINVITNTMKHGGAILFLWLASPTITVFFIWQIVASALQISLISAALWWSLPKANRAPRFDWQHIRNVWRFAAGMSGITALALILTQFDKIILSKLLPLKEFGYYVLAVTVSGGLTAILITPIYNALLPRFSALVALSDETALKQLYHRGSQFMAATILPIATFTAVFSFDVLLLWTRQFETAQNTSPILSILVLGTALNGIMNLPYILQISNGWTTIGLRINLLLIVIMVPAIFFLTKCCGSVGGAFAWLILNVVYMSIAVPLTHRRLLKGEARRWFVVDQGLALVVTLIVVGVGRWFWLMFSPLPQLAAFFVLAGILFSAIMAAVFSASQLRGWLWSWIVKRRSSYV